MVGQTSHEHRVQFYDGDASALAVNVGRFAAEGLRRGDGILIIAGADHRRAFARAAVSAGADVEWATRHGRWIALDAARTLESFLVDGQPDWQRFQSVLEPVIRALRANGAGIRAYGEMVGILWQAGRYDAASQLEGFWNRVLGDGGLELFCAYPIDIFGTEFRSADVDALLCAHTHVVPAADAELESAVTRAMREVLGSDVETLDVSIETGRRDGWPALPRCEATIVVAQRAPAFADEIIARARRYYAAA